MKDGKRGDERFRREPDASIKVNAETAELTDDLWRAIVSNDSSFDGKFFYAVKTTGIFCRPSCKSRIPNKEHVRIFWKAREAQSAHFRPCKRCKPDGIRLPDEEWTDQIAEWINNNYAKALTLDMLADAFHGSPYHLHRIFKRNKGMTPAEYVQHIRISRAKQYLTYTDKTIADIGLAVGISNPSHFATLFQKKTGLTPTDYRRSNGTNIDQEEAYQPWS